MVWAVNKAAKPKQAPREGRRGTQRKLSGREAKELADAERDAEKEQLFHDARVLLADADAINTRGRG